MVTSLKSSATATTTPQIDTTLLNKYNKEDANKDSQVVRIVKAALGLLVDTSAKGAHKGLDGSQRIVEKSCSSTDASFNSAHRVVDTSAEYSNKEVDQSVSEGSLTKTALTAAKLFGLF